MRQRRQKALRSTWYNLSSSHALKHEEEVKPISEKFQIKLWWHMKRFFPPSLKNNHFASHLCHKLFRDKRFQTSLLHLHYNEIFFVLLAKKRGDAETKRKNYEVHCRKYLENSTRRFSFQPLVPNLSGN